MVPAPAEIGQAEVRRLADLDRSSEVCWRVAPSGSTNLDRADVKHMIAAVLEDKVPSVLPDELDLAAFLRAPSTS